MNSEDPDMADHQCCFAQDYGKSPKISYTKVSDKMSHANSVDPNQTAPEGIHYVPFYYVYFKGSIPSQHST